MLNRLNPTNQQIAKIRYLESDFQVLSPGTHVLCAITGNAIPLDELKYWSFQDQEAYQDADASLEAERRAGRLR